MSKQIPKEHEFTNKYISFVINNISEEICMVIKDDDLYVIKNFSKTNIIKYFTKRKILSMIYDKEMNNINKYDYFKTSDDFKLFYKTFVDYSIPNLHKNLWLDYYNDLYTKYSKKECIYKDIKDFQHNIIEKIDTKDIINKYNKILFMFEGKVVNVLDKKQFKTESDLIKIVNLISERTIYDYVMILNEYKDINTLIYK